MAHKDWKKYYAVVFEKTGYVAGQIYKSREHAYRVARDTTLKRMLKPVAVISIRGRKHNVHLQKYLMEKSI